MVNSYRYSNNYRKKENKFWKKFKIVFFIIIISIVTIGVFSKNVNSTGDVFSISKLPVIKQFRQIFGIENLKGENRDRINFLLLGQGGAGHDGPYLTDTIIFASLKPSTKELTMFSIPRDFFVEIKGYGWHRINAANSYGETSGYKGGGAAFTATIIEEIFDQPVDYWLRVDFDAFQEVVNDLGGINICVDTSFEDHFYPTEDYDVETISFEEGCQKMDGETALKYSRSRHGTNFENSDFARSARQQKVILAVKDKGLSLTTITNPTKIFKLFNSLKDNIQTNIEIAQIPHFLNILKDIDSNSIKKIVLDNSAGGLLRNGMTESGMYILKPRTGNLKEIQNLAKYIFILKDQTMEPVNVVILNGTEIRGWATDIEGYLEQLGFNILSTGNSPSETTFEKSVIYDLRKLRETVNDNSSSKQALTVLRKSLNANVSKHIPEFLNDEEVENFNKADFLVVLGCKENGECWIENEIYQELDEDLAKEEQGTTNN